MVDIGTSCTKVCNNFQFSMMSMIKLGRYTSSSNITKLKKIRPRINGPEHMDIKNIKANSITADDIGIKYQIFENF